MSICMAQPVKNYNNVHFDKKKHAHYTQYYCCQQRPRVGGWCKVKLRNLLWLSIALTNRPTHLTDFLEVRLRQWHHGWATFLLWGSLLSQTAAKHTIGSIMGEEKRLTRDFWKSVTLDDNKWHSSGFKRLCSGISALKHDGQGQRVSWGLDPLPHSIQYSCLRHQGSLLPTMLLFVC